MPLGPVHLPRRVGRLRLPQGMEPLSVSRVTALSLAVVDPLAVETMDEGDTVPPLRVPRREPIVAPQLEDGWDEEG